MSWHSKWHNIKHKKALNDAKKWKVYTKLQKLVEMASRNWADPSLNPSLQTAIEKARQNNLPRDIIERAIKKWSWQSWWEQLVDIMYEGYGTWGTAIILKCITSNTKRSWANVRAILAKYWGNLWEPWSVSWQFHEKWVIYVTGKSKIEKIKGKDIEIILPLIKNEFEEFIIWADIEDYEITQEWARIVTSRDSFIQVLKYIELWSYKIIQSDLEYTPENYITLSDEEYNKLERLIEALEEDEDVDTVYHNAE